jgi:hypothetical protein
VNLEPDHLFGGEAVNHACNSLGSCHGLGMILWQKQTTQPKESKHNHVVPWVPESV